MRGSLVFNLFLLAIPAYFVWSCFSYVPTARYIPLLIGIPALVLQVWVILQERSPSRSGAFDLSILDLGGGQRLAPAQAESTHPADEGRQVILISLWMALYFVLFCLVGAYPATFSFVVLFLLVSSRTSWRLALAISTGTVVTLWALFGLIMRYQLYEGALFGGLVPPL